MVRGTCCHEALYTAISTVLNVMKFINAERLKTLAQIIDEMNSTIFVAVVTTGLFSPSNAGKIEPSDRI